MMVIELGIVRRLGDNPQRATGTILQRGTIPNKRGGDQPPPGDSADSPKTTGPLSAFIALLDTLVLAVLKDFLLKVRTQRFDLIQPKPALVGWEGAAGIDHGSA